MSAPVTASRPSPNPRRVAAGRLNRLKRRGLTPQGRERLRQCALAGRPWEHATGPRTPQGKARSARNGKARQRGGHSVREVRALLGGLGGLLHDMAAGRRLVRELLGRGGELPGKNSQAGG
jgi:hypothetical protein